MPIIVNIYIHTYIDKSNAKKQQGEVFYGQIFDENNRRIVQGKKFSGKKAGLSEKHFIIFVENLAN